MAAPIAIGLRGRCKKLLSSITMSFGVATADVCATEAARCECSAVELNFCCRASPRVVREAESGSSRRGDEMLSIDGSGRRSCSFSFNITEAYGCGMRRSVGAEGDIRTRWAWVDGIL